MLRLSLFEISHLFNLFNSSFRVFSTVAEGLLEKNIVVSSANRKLDVEVFTISLM